MQFLQITISQSWTEASLSGLVGYTRQLVHSGTFAVAGGSQKFFGSWEPEAGELRTSTCVPQVCPALCQSAERFRNPIERN